MIHVWYIWSSKKKCWIKQARNKTVLTVCFHPYEGQEEMKTINSAWIKKKSLTLGGRMMTRRGGML